MNGKTSITALMSAFGRAYHLEHSSSPVFSDTIAKVLMTDQEYAMIGKYILEGIDFFAPDKKNAFKSDQAALDYLVNTQIAPTPLARAGYCESCLKTAMLTGTRQYVILGAGLDSFAFREREFMEKYQVFEVDHPQTQADKLNRIARAGLEKPANLHFVPVDLSIGGLREGLLNAGFDPTKKAFFSWLGVSYYLSAEDIGAMLESIATISAEGSSLVFDYGDSGLFSSEARRVQNMLAMVRAAGEPMLSCFGQGELEMLLEKHGFLIYELMTAEDIQQRYFSCCGNSLTAFENINYATAVYKPRTRLQH